MFTAAVADAVVLTVVFVFFFLPLLCVRLFISFHFICVLEIALFHFLLRFCLIFSYSLYLSVGELDRTFLAIVFAMIAFCSGLFFSQSVFIENLHRWFSRADTQLWWFFSEHSNQGIIIVKYYGVVVNVVYSQTHTHICQHMILRSNLYRNTCANRLVFIIEIKTFLSGLKLEMNVHWNWDIRCGAELTDWLIDELLWFHSPAWIKKNTKTVYSTPNVHEID